MEIGGVLNSVFVTGESGRTSFGIILRLESVFVKNINGKTLGRTLNAHAEIPSSEALMNLAGFKIMLNRKNTIRALRIIVVGVCPKYLNFFKKLTLFYLTFRLDFL